ncbi:MAG: ribosome maturation factor RimM [Roseivirga sp.]
MLVNDCYQLGYVIKPHGLRGEVQIFLDVDAPGEYETLESVFVLQGQQLVPFFIESIAVRSDKAIVAFEEIETVEAARALKGSALYLPLDNLPELGENDFYYHELIGFSLKSNAGELIGEVKSVLEAGAQELLAVTHPSGKEILVPLTDSLIDTLNKTEKELVMIIPEGLLDVYLNEES